MLGYPPGPDCTDCPFDVCNSWTLCTKENQIEDGNFAADAQKYGKNAIVDTPGFGASSGFKDGLLFDKMIESFRLIRDDVEYTNVFLLVIDGKAEIIDEAVIHMLE